MGANVLHEDAIYPVKDANIPIVIRNTNQPDNPGTQIVDHVDPAQEDRSRFVTGIAGKKDFTVITMYRHNASNEVGLWKRALEVQMCIRDSSKPFGLNCFHCSSAEDSR